MQTLIRKVSEMIDFQCQFFIYMCLILLFLHIFTDPVVADQSIIIEADTQYSYAENRFSEKDYLTAIVEYKRFVRFFPDDRRVPEATFKVGMSWYNGGKYGEALSIFDTISGGSANGSYYIDAWFMAAQCHLKANNPVGAEIHLENLIRTTEDTDAVDRALNTIGWIRIDTGRWKHAEESFRKIGSGNRDLYQAGRISDALRRSGEIPRKNPTLAGSLALLPGAGFFYCERYRDAFIAFLLNGGMIYAAYESFDNDHHALGGLISFVGFGFYAGNIYGSVTGAHKYNRNADRVFSRELKSSFQPELDLGVFYLPERNAPGLALQIVF